MTLRYLLEKNAGWVLSPLEAPSFLSLGAEFLLHFQVWRDELSKSRALLLEATSLNVLEVKLDIHLEEAGCWHGYSAVFSWLNIKTVSQFTEARVLHQQHFAVCGVGFLKYSRPDRINIILLVSSRSA